MLLLAWVFLVQAQRIWQLGLYDAKLDHSPVLALTGLVARQMIGPGSIQEIDQYAYFEPICVFNKILMSEDQTTMLATLGD